MTREQALGARPLRGAVVGYGFISGNGHVPAYLERARTRGDVEIVAVADVCEARRARASDAIRGVRLYGDFESLLRAEREGLDFVDIATPPCDHASIALAALDAGLHVLCEKPLTTTVEAARELMRRAEKARRVLFPCHNYKHAPVVEAIREVIASGRIGAVRGVTLSTYRTTHARGVSEWRPDWRRERRLAGGGIAMDHGSHSFYLTFEWLAALPTAVSARTWNTGGASDTEDGLGAVLTFPTGVAQVHLTWTAGVRKVIYALQGDRGAITVTDDDMEIATLTPDGKAGPIERVSIASHWMDASHVRWFDSLFTTFRAAIDADDFVGAETCDAYHCVQTIQACYRSAAEGGREISLRPEACASVRGARQLAL